MDTVADFLSSKLALVAAAMLGAVWGSFFNVVIARVPAGESVVRPASRCPSCRHPVAARDNIPIISYFWLRGRCRRCGATISWRYPLVEVLTSLLAAAIFWKFSGSDAAEIVAVRLGRFVVYFALGGTLIVLAFIDLDTKRLPDVITMPGIVVFFLAAFAAHDVPWLERAIGIAAGYLFVRLVADFYYYVLKREGMGLGDGKLLAMVGGVFGWKALPVILFLASLTGSAVSIPLLLLARKRQADPTSLRRAQVPFGPFLATGALIYLFEGPRILALVLPAG